MSVKGSVTGHGTGFGTDSASLTLTFACRGTENKVRKLAKDNQPSCFPSVNVSTPTS